MNALRMGVRRRLGLALATLASCGLRDADETTKVARLPQEAQVRVVDGAVRVRLSRAAFEAHGIEVAAAHLEPLHRYAEFAAQAVSMPGRSVSLVAPIAGRLVVRDDASEGSRVERGRVVFTIEPLIPPEREVPGRAERSGLAEQRIARERARSLAIADSIAANAELDAASAESNREEQLLADGSGTQQAVARARTRLAVAKSTAESAQRIAALYADAPLEEPVATAARMEIAAPFDATVSSIHTPSGSITVAGTPVVDLVALDPLLLRVVVPVTEIGSLDLDAAADLIDGSSAGREVPTCSAFPRADFASGTVELDYLLENDDHSVRIGQRLRIRVKQRSQPEAVVVPAGAVIVRPGGSALVYVALEDLEFVQREVSLERIDDERAWILAGIRDGESVVAGGANVLLGVANTAPHGN